MAKGIDKKGGVMKKIVIVSVAFVAIFIVLALPPASAQNYPTKAIRFIVA
jgi:tripartite-type tricarboxylate transporter receptor subunit TctC